MNIILTIILIIFEVVCGLVGLVWNRIKRI